MKDYRNKKAGRFGNVDYLLQLRAIDIARGGNWLGMYSDWAMEEREYNQMKRKALGRKQK